MTQAAPHARTSEINLDERLTIDYPVCVPASSCMCSALEEMRLLMNAVERRGSALKSLHRKKSHNGIRKP